MKTIRIACDTKDSVSLDTLVQFQGDLKNLSKENLEKLKKEILTTGFAFPILVWRDKKKNFILGGHQRVQVLRDLRDNDGFEIPEVPIVLVEAKNLQEAKRRILQDVAQYGEVTSTGLTAFLEESKIDFSDVIASFKIPEIDLDFLCKAISNEQPKKVEFFAKPKSGESDDENKKDDHTHECPRCGHQFD